MSPRRSPRVSVTIALTILAGVLAALAGILGNIATSSIPPFAVPYLRHAWLAFGVVVLLGIGVAVWQIRREALASSLPPAAQKSTSSPAPTPQLAQQHAPGTYHTCVLSYATEDQQFAEKLHTDLQQQGVSCWFAPHDLKTGDKIRTQIYEAIGKNDKLLIVLSEHSINSLWVEEDEAALDREHQQPGTLMLFPVRIDETVMRTTRAWAIAVRQRYIGDLRQWNDETTYQRALQRLLRDLKA